jgi:hypothetical protein
MVTAAVQRRLGTIDELVHELRAGPRNDTAFFRAALSEGPDGARLPPRRSARGGSPVPCSAVRPDQRRQVVAFGYNSALIDLG